MQRVSIALFLLVSSISHSVPTHQDRNPDWKSCVAPLKTYRALVITKAVRTSERGGWELTAPGGDTPDLLDCASNWLGTIDVVDGAPRPTTFQFPTKALCESALAKMKTATKEFPAVIVIDKDCKAHLAN